MSSAAAAQKKDQSPVWRGLCRMYPLYSMLARQLEAELCPVLEASLDEPGPDAVARVEAWFDQMDERIQVHQLREAFQTHQASTEDVLRTLIQRHLARPHRSAGDRDKLDFLLVQYYAHFAEHGPGEETLTLEQVAEAMSPVLGPVDPTFPAWTRPLSEVLAQTNTCTSLDDLLRLKALERGREIKGSAGEAYFEPAALLTMTWFNFLMRRSFFRLLQADVHAVREALHALHSRGIQTVDCTAIGRSAAEPLDALRPTSDWKNPFRAPYSGGHSFKELVEVRKVLEQALAKLNEN